MIHSGELSLVKWAYFASGSKLSAVEMKDSADSSSELYKSGSNKFSNINSKNQIEAYKKPLRIAHQRFFSE